jgi:hypothetical protein
MGCKSAMPEDCVGKEHAQGSQRRKEENGILVDSYFTHKSEDGCVGGTRLTKRVISIEKLNE